MRHEGFLAYSGLPLLEDALAEYPSRDHETIKVALLDNQDRRRTDVSYWLSKSGCVVQPFDGVEELSHHLPSEGLLLIADEVGLIGSTVKLLRSRARVQPFVTYASHLSASRMIKAIRMGAVDYVSWPDGRLQLLEAITSEVERSRSVVPVERGNGGLSEFQCSISNREFEILGCFGNPMSPHAVERQLGIGFVEARAQALAVMHKLTSPDFSHALEVATSRRSWERELYEEMRKMDALIRVDRLSPREREVLSQIAKGSSSKEAAAMLGISNRTVDAHRTSIFAKIEVRNVAEATQVAVFGGLV